MGQAREVCPHCGRKPGEQHGRFGITRKLCPRSAENQRRLASWAASAGEGNYVIERQAPALQRFLAAFLERQMKAKEKA